MSKTLLYVGAGLDRQVPRLEEFRGMELVTLDADPEAGCDVVGDMTDLDECLWKGTVHTIEDVKFDAIYSRHSLEHVATWRVPVALRSWYDHLTPGGLVVIQLPNLAEACRVLIEQGWNATMYVSPMGPIRPIDVLFGHAGMTEKHPYYQHLTGFTADRLCDELRAAGFEDVGVAEVGDQREDLFGHGRRL